MVPLSETSCPRRPSFTGSILANELIEVLFIFLVNRCVICYMWFLTNIAVATPEHFVV